MATYEQLAKKAVEERDFAQKTAKFNYEVSKKAEQERDAALARVQSLLGQLATDPDKQLLDILRLENADFRTQLETALARVKELEDEVTRTLMEMNASEVRFNKQIDSLASDVQCAKLAAELASKEREALRDFTRDVLSFMKAHGNKKGGQIQLWTERLMERAADLLGTEEPK